MKNVLIPFDLEFKDELKQIPIKLYPILYSFNNSDINVFIDKNKEVAIWLFSIDHIRIIS